MQYARSRHFLLVLLALVAALSATVLTAAPAQAVTGCFGATCNGQDPHEMNCDSDPGLQTIYEFTYSARFELRYSPACKASWTRVTSPVTYNTIFGQIRAHYTYPTSLGHPTALVYGVQARAGTTWTRMVNADYWERSCVSSWFNAIPIACTGAH